MRTVPGIALRGAPSRVVVKCSCGQPLRTLLPGEVLVTTRGVGAEFREEEIQCPDPACMTRTKLRIGREA